MSLKCGIVGLPNAGKSTLFNALTNSSSAETGNYPFCTIEANRGRVYVPDSRLQKISAIFKPLKTVPCSFEFIDIAGLVKGASQGEGLGNQFLSHIRETDSLIHLIRGFEDSQITHVYGGPDPVRDREIVNTELLLSDLERAQKRLQKIQKTAQATGDKTLKKECRLLTKVLLCLEKGQSLRGEQWSKEETALLKPLHFISLKPVLYVGNLKEGDFVKTAEGLPELKKQLGPKEELICVSCALEAEMSGWTDQEKTAFLKPLGLKEPALNTVIKKAFRLLGLISFFTAGEKEVRAWTLPKGGLAPQAGGVIHSDFEKGFIKAELYSSEQLFKTGSYKGLKEKGLLRAVGRDYEVQDGDIMHFLFHRP